MKLIICVFCSFALIYSCKKENKTIKTQNNSVKSDTVVAPNNLPPGSFTVINKGVSANNTYDLLNRLDVDVLKTSANLVVIMIGSNDARTVGKIIPVSEYQTNLSTIVSTIQAVGKSVLLLSPPPIGTVPLVYPNAVNQHIDSVTLAMETVSVKHNCMYLDINALFKSQGSPNATKASLLNNLANAPDHPDGLHLTADGDKFIADQVFTYLKSKKKLIYPNINCFGDSLTYGLYLNGAGTSTGDTYPSYLLLLLNQ